jgi:phosphoribosylglycinamide formyltransferase-1
LIENYGTRASAIAITSIEWRSLTLAYGTNVVRSDLDAGCQAILQVHCEKRIIRHTVKKIGILISGRGSNMIALADAARESRIGNAEIALVISNVEAALGLERARERGIETIFLSHKGKAREEHDRTMAAELHRRKVDLICLAGYMRLLSPWFIREFENRVLNIHPSLLPAFSGLDAQKQAIVYGVKVTGCSVHLVDEQLDHGPIVKQAAVPVQPDDTVESLSARILAEEHRIYPEAVALILSGKYRIEGRRVVEC